MNSELLPAVVIPPPNDTPNVSVIWLHGLGADGHDFEPIVPQLNISNSASIRFIFPHAPMRSVTINGGATMRAWYDIKSLDLKRNIERDQLEESRQQIENWISHERKLGIATEKIFLAGFSQGGAIALYTALQSNQRLGGVIALSCYHPAPEIITVPENKSTLDLPIFIGHGTLDAIIPIMLGKQTMKTLCNAGYTPDWHSYKMPHSVCPEEVKDISDWLRFNLLH